MSEVWHSQPNMSGEFQPPPPPPYPGTGRMTPGMHMRAPFLPDHRASVMSPMPPQSPGKQLCYMTHLSCVMYYAVVFNAKQYLED